MNLYDCFEKQTEHVLPDFETILFVHETWTRKFCEISVSFGAHTPKMLHTWFFL